MKYAQGKILHNEIIIQDLGTNQDYKKTWDYQELLLNEIVEQKRNLVKNRKKKTNNYLLFVEHPHVYTLGKSGNIENILADENLLQKIHATFIKTNRGGDITYHGPGQLVGYPILNLDQFKTDINWYLRSLEEVIIQLLAHYKLKGERSPGETGVWLDVGNPYARKICAMGVKASRWVTMHGFALNVNADLKYFEYIIPCGIKNKQVSSLAKELNRDVNMQEVKNLYTQLFKEIFLIK